MNALPASLLTAAAVMAACQLFKAVVHSLRERRPAPSWLVSAGGMPSAHAAFVTALAASVGLRSGTGSDLFAVTCVFAAITVYDAWRLRGAVESHARLLLALAARHPGIDAPPLTTRLGHTLPEIAAGIVVGGGLAAAVFSLA